MNRNIKRTVAVMAISVPLLSMTVNQATAACVPSAAIPAVPGTPEVPGVPAVEAVLEVSHMVKVVDTEAVAEVWANFSPNHQQGPFEGPPSYPSDARGTWHNHGNIPGGHVGPDGVYQRDNPHSGRADWFYRMAGKPEVSHMVKVVDIEAQAGIPAIPLVPATPGTPAVPAVTCKPPVNKPPVTPPVNKPPVVTKPTPSITIERLPKTGVEDVNWQVATGGLVLLAAGAATMVLVRRRF